MAETWYVLIRDNYDEHGRLMPESSGNPVTIHWERDYIAQQVGEEPHRPGEGWSAWRMVEVDGC